MRDAATLKIDLKPGSPVYRQIVEAIRFQISTGALQTGDRLPPVNVLAKKLKVNRLTVMRAYQELQSSQIASSNYGGGTVITGQLDRDRAVRFLNKLPESGLISQFESVSHHAQLCSLATVLPDPNLQRVEEMSAAFSDFGHLGEWATYLPPAAGHPELLRAGAQFLKSRFPAVDAKHLCCTYGSSAGMRTAISVLCTRRNHLAILRPNLVLARLIAEHEHVRATVIDSLEDLHENDLPDAILTSSMAHPITGGGMTPFEQKSLIETCINRDIVILDNLPFAFFGSPNDVPLAALAPEGRVVTNLGLDTHLCAGLSIGFLICSGALRVEFGKAQFAGTMGVSAILQLGAARYLDLGFGERQLQRYQKAYTERMRALNRALLALLKPIGCSWKFGDSGCNVLVHLPPGCRADEIYSKALARGVAVLPGSQMLVRDPESVIRLSCTMQALAAFSGAVEVLADVIRQQLAIIGAKDVKSHR